MLIAGCDGGESVRHVPHLGYTPYQQDSILVTYATDPERALTLLDSVRNEPTELMNVLDMLIATEIGLSSANLREQFKRKYGITPVEYRQNMNI